MVKKIWLIKNGTKSSGTKSSCFVVYGVFGLSLAGAAFCEGSRFNRKIAKNCFCCYYCITAHTQRRIDTLAHDQRESERVQSAMRAIRGKAADHRAKQAALALGMVVDHETLLADAIWCAGQHRKLTDLSGYIHDEEERAGAGGHHGY